MTRWVMVDDTNPAIVYKGPWFAEKGNLDAIGNWGPPYMDTVHGITSGGSLSYGFSGTSIIITGAVQVPRSAQSNAGNTTWQCIIDGAPVAVADPAQAENRVTFCEKDGLADGPHTFELVAAGTAQQTFWFDELQYVPGSTGAGYAGADVSVDASDPLVQFGVGWDAHFPGFVTNETGANIHFAFNGVSAVWYGFYDSAFPFAATTATYSVDGNTPVSFALNGVIADPVQWLHPLFTTPALPPGPHTLDVVYHGDSAGTPLGIETIVVLGWMESEANAVPGSAGTNSATGVPPSSLTTVAPVTASSPTTSSGSSGLSSNMTSGGTASGSSTSTEPVGTSSSVLPSTAATASGSNSTASGPSGALPDSAHGQLHKGAIGGGAAAAGVLLILAGAALFLWFRRQRRYRAIPVQRGMEFGDGLL